MSAKPKHDREGVPIEPVATDCREQPLPTIQRPRFFAGQLLTSDALTDLEEWARARLRLGRLRHGWGVVCGLGVSVVPGEPVQFRLHAGYAVAPSGDDLVVPCDAIFSLQGLCRTPTAGGCAQPTLAAPPSGKAVSVGPLEVDEAHLRWVDLYLHPKDESVNPVTAFNRPPRLPRCEESGIREGYEVRYVVSPVNPLPPPSSPLPPPPASDDLVRNWAKGLTGFDTTGVPEDKIKDVRANLSRLFDGAAGASPFGFATAWLASLTNDQLRMPWRLAELTLWVATAYRARPHPCPPCCPALGVKLARLWMRVSGGPCAVLYVERGPSHLASLPHAPAVGPIDLNRYLGQKKEVVAESLAVHGVQAGQSDFEMPATVSDALKFLANAPEAVRRGEKVVLCSPANRSAPTPDPLADRVVGFQTVDPGPALVSTTTWKPLGIQVTAAEKQDVGLRYETVDPVKTPDLKALPTTGWVRLAFDVAPLATGVTPKQLFLASGHPGAAKIAHYDLQGSSTPTPDQKLTLTVEADGLFRKWTTPDLALVVGDATRSTVLAPQVVPPVHERSGDYKLTVTWKPDGNLFPGEEVKVTSRVTNPNPWKSKVQLKESDTKPTPTALAQGGAVFVEMTVPEAKQGQVGVLTTSQELVVAGDKPRWVWLATEKDEAMRPVAAKSDELIHQIGPAVRNVTWDVTEDLTAASNTDRYTVKVTNGESKALSLTDLMIAPTGSKAGPHAIANNQGQENVAGNKSWERKFDGDAGLETWRIAFREAGTDHVVVVTKP